MMYGAGSIWIISTPLIQLETSHLLCGATTKLILCNFNLRIIKAFDMELWCINNPQKDDIKPLFSLSFSLSSRLKMKYSLDSLSIRVFISSLMRAISDILNVNAGFVVMRSLHLLLMWANVNF